MKEPVNRRSVLRALGAGVTPTVTGCSVFQNDENSQDQTDPTPTENDAKIEDQTNTTTEQATNEERETDDPTSESPDLVEEDLAERLTRAEVVDDTLTYVALNEDDKKFVTHGDEEHPAFFDLFNDANEDDLTMAGNDLVYQAAQSREDGRQAVVVRDGEVAAEGVIQDVGHGRVLRRKFNDEGDRYFDGESRITFEEYGPVEDAVYVDEGVAAVVRYGERQNAVIKDGEFLDTLSEEPLPEAYNPIDNLGEVAGDPVYNKYVRENSNLRTPLYRDGEVVWEKSRADEFTPEFWGELNGEMVMVLVKRDDIEDENRSKLSKVWKEGEEFGPHETIFGVSWIDGEVAYLFGDYDEDGMRLMHGDKEIGTQYREVIGMADIGGDLIYKARLPPEDRPDDTPDKDQVVVYDDNEFGPYNQVGNIFEYENGLAFVAQTEEDALYASRKLFHEQ